MSDNTSRLGLPFLASGQAQKHVTINESLLRLDALVQLAVVSATLAAQPVSPADGDIYILPAGKTGAAWTAMADNALAYYRDGIWEAITPKEGWRAYIADVDVLVTHNGAAWVSPALQNAPMLGINASADTTNRLAVASAASLFNHAGAGHQHKINKAAAGDTGSLLFQTGFSGRTELGLMGDDHFRIKVSADGATWASAITIDKTNGRLGLNDSAPTSQLTINGNSVALPTPASGTLLHIGGANAALPRIMIDGFAAAPLINFRRANGSAASPSALASGDGMGGFNWFGYGASAYSSSSLLELSAIATETWSNTAQGCAFRFFTTPNGSTTKAERLRVDQDGAIIIRAAAQILVDGSGHVALRSYAISGLPSAATADRLIWCSDLAGGAGALESDGTSWKRMRPTGYAAVATDANFTWTPLSSAPSTRHTGTLTADRTVTLSATNAYAGLRARFTRTGAGAFNLSVGGLKNLATNTWCEVEYDGSAWYLAAYGPL